MRRLVPLLSLLLLSVPAWAETTPNVAYFSLEMGSPQLRGQRTGGLGVLAMDLVRGMARELVPRGGEVVGVTLLYDKAWAQRIDQDGNQVFDDVPLDPSDWVRRGILKEVTTLPVKVAGKTHQVTVYEERLGKARILRLYAPGVTRMLYNGSREERLLQELILGKAGLAALKHIGARPDVIHLNESHTAFAGVFARQDPAFDRARIVSTTHTPVEAGLERFEMDDWQKIVDSELDPKWKGHFERNGKLDLTQAMFKTSEIINAVSDEHTDVMKGMYSDFADQIVSVQNGVDPEYWQHPTIKSLKNPTNQQLWKVKQPLRQTLIDEVKNRTGVQLAMDRPIVALTRRQTEYKQTLPMLRDHIKQICGDRDKGGLGMQVVIAGVAHPNDGTGKDWIRQFNEWMKDPELKGRFVFVPDYLGPHNDLELDRIAVQGADVWLTTPRPGLEASGTSDRRSLVNLGIQIWTNDTGGGRDYVVPFDEETRVGNGFFLDPYDTGALYDRLGRISKMFYGMTEKGDTTYLSLLGNIKKTIPKVAIARNVKTQIARTYLPALQRQKITGVHVAAATGPQRFDKRMPVSADVDIGDLDPKEIEVELVWGPSGKPTSVQRMRLHSAQGGKARFVSSLAPFEDGEHRYQVRVAGRASPPSTVMFSEQGMSEQAVSTTALQRWFARYRGLRLSPKVLASSKTWTFTDEQKANVTLLRPHEPLVIKNAKPFTVLSGPVGARDDMEVTAVKQGKEWIAVLRPPAGRRWMTFKWHDQPGGRWEHRNYHLQVPKIQIRGSRSARSP